MARPDGVNVQHQKWAISNNFISTSLNYESKQWKLIIMESILTDI